MTTASGSRKKACPTTSMMLRTRCGSRLFTMSMRMCSLASSVHGEHSRNTALNSTHCSSSQTFDEVSNTLRTVALTAETSTATRISHATRLPIQVVAASIARVTGSNAFSTASRAPNGNPPVPNSRRTVIAAGFSFLFFVLSQSPGPPAKRLTLSRWRHEASMKTCGPAGVFCVRVFMPVSGPPESTRYRPERGDAGRRIDAT